MKVSEVHMSSVAVSKLFWLIPDFGLTKMSIGIFCTSEIGSPGARRAEFGQGHQTGKGESGQTQSKEDEPGGDLALSIWPQSGASNSGNQIWCSQETDQKEEGNPFSWTAVLEWDESGPVGLFTGFLLSQSDTDPVLKLELDDEGLGSEGGTGENAAAKPKAPRVKKEKKEPG